MGFGDLVVDHSKVELQYGPMKIRSADNEDFDTVLQFCKELSPNFSDEILQKSFPAILRDKNAILLIAEEGANAFGFIEVHVQWSLQSGFHAVIRALYVSEKHRRSGCARMLVQHAQERALEIGVKKIVVQSKIKRTIADQFYQKMGYSKFKQQNVYQKSLTR